MEELMLEFAICAVAAAVLMAVHEWAKAAVYMGIQRYRKNRKAYTHSIWEIYRYIDWVGILFAITSSVTFSKPYMFRIRDKKTNRILGITGFLVLLSCFAGSMVALRLHAFGVSGMQTLEGHGMPAKAASLLLQYLAILSLGMFIANLFPVSTFDMGLLIAGFSSRKYLAIIKMDAVIKMIFILTVILNLIQYGGYRLISFLLQ